MFIFWLPLDNELTTEYKHNDFRRTRRASDIILCLDTPRTVFFTELQLDYSSMRVSDDKSVARCGHDGK